MGKECSIHGRDKKYVGDFSRKVTKTEGPHFSATLQAHLELNTKKLHKELRATKPVFLQIPQSQYRGLQELHINTTLITAPYQRNCN
jgi:hypothetical protein